MKSLNTRAFDVQWINAFVLYIMLLISMLWNRKEMIQIN